MNFLDKIKLIFEIPLKYVTTLDNEFLNIYEDKITHITKMTATGIENSFLIKNPNKLEISHICTDGVLISYGKTFNSSTNSQKRSDAVVFSSKTFLFIELKLDVKKLSKDETKYSEFSKAMRQLENIILYFKNSFEKKNEIFFNYYPCNRKEQNVFAVIAMKFYPKFKSNSQRNNEINKFFEKTGVRLKWKLFYEIEK